VTKKLKHDEIEFETKQEDKEEGKINREFDQMEKGTASKRLSSNSMESFNIGSMETVVVHV
jgi:hypothetical protein